MLQWSLMLPSAPLCSFFPIFSHAGSTHEKNWASSETCQKSHLILLWLNMAISSLHWLLYKWLQGKLWTCSILIVLQEASWDAEGKQCIINICQIHLRSLLTEAYWEEGKVLLIFSEVGSSGSSWCSDDVVWQYLMMPHI